ncbi:MAG TPA: MaoC/PaaZ C-terminal domain-containing protein [Myxococcales bacterium]|nr:MaoC/PaaZ C-terminal domain-containing protein [Myxococcales bacterium]
MPPRKLYFEAVRVGDELPAVAKAPIDRVQLARYAGASGDFNPVHVDEAYARSIGMPSVYAPGMLVMGFLGQLVSDWARGAQLRKYNVKFIKIVWPGDTVVCKGRVTDRWGEGGRYFADIDLWAENQKGELVMKGQSEIQLFYSLEDENRQRAGQSPVVVNVPRESLIQQASAPAESARPAETSGAKKAQSQAPKKTAARDKPQVKKPAVKSAGKK